MCTGRNERTEKVEVVGGVLGCFRHFWLENKVYSGGRPYYVRSVMAFWVPVGLWRLPYCSFNPNTICVYHLDVTFKHFERLFSCPESSLVS